MCNTTLLSTNLKSKNLHSTKVISYAGFMHITIQRVPYCDNLLPLQKQISKKQEAIIDLSIYIQINLLLYPYLNTTTVFWNVF